VKSTSLSGCRMVVSFSSCPPKPGILAAIQQRACVFCVNRTIGSDKPRRDSHDDGERGAGSQCGNLPRDVSARSIAQQLSAELLRLVSGNVLSARSLCLRRSSADLGNG
jgi:hypothetical protein